MRRRNWGVAVVIGVVALLGWLWQLPTPGETRANEVLAACEQLGHGTNTRKDLEVGLGPPDDHGSCADFEDCRDLTAEASITDVWIYYYQIDDTFIPLQKFLVRSGAAFYIAGDGKIAGSTPIVW